MQKITEGIIVSLKMQNTAVVLITQRKVSPLYKKIIKKDKKIKADIVNHKVVVGDRVRIVQTRPVSKDKHFKILEVIKK